MAFKFKLIRKCFQDARGVEYGDADFLLEEDNWNDYSYYVTYHLHATPRLTHEQTEYLGYIKIMQKGQRSGQSEMVRQFISPKEEFEELPASFVSLTQSIDLFDGLNHLLNADQKKEFVKQMHLILSSENDDYYPIVKREPAFEKGLLRDSSMQSFSLAKGREIMLSGETHYDLREQELVVSFNNIAQPIKLHFSFLPEIKSNIIPNGVVTFIGKNGSGKSTLIYELAKILYAYPDYRFKLKDDIGGVEPNDIGISKLFLISYSPFDNFVLPGIGGEDYRLFLKGMESGKGRLVFCGIRDVKSEFERLLQNPDETTYNNLYKQLRIDETTLKPVRILAQECSKAMAVVNSSSERMALWEEIMSRASTNFPDISEKMKNMLGDPDNMDIEDFFNFSTGFKYYLHALSHVVAYIEKDSMLLFDEPENHIHPPMLSFMMSSLRRVIAKYDSVLMVATHSPVIVQESFAENVFVVRNFGDKTSVTHPIIETYGANVSEITSEVFDLTTDVSSYYDAYDKLYELWEMEKHWNNVSEMMNSIADHMKGKISNQMLSYIISKYYDNHQEEIKEGGESSCGF